MKTLLINTFSSNDFFDGPEFFELNLDSIPYLKDTISKLSELTSSDDFKIYSDHFSEITFYSDTIGQFKDYDLDDMVLEEDIVDSFCAGEINFLLVDSKDLKFYNTDYRTTCQRVHFFKDCEFYISCSFKNSSNVIESKPVKLEDILSALG